MPGRADRAKHAGHDSDRNCVVAFDVSRHPKYIRCKGGRADESGGGGARAQARRQDRQDAGARGRRMAQIARQHPGCHVPGGGSEEAIRGSRMKWIGGHSACQAVRAAI